MSPRVLRPVLVASLVGAVVATTLTAPATAGAPTPTVAPRAALSIAVHGVGTDTYPAFDPEITRYAVRTTDLTDGSLSVEVATASGERVYVDGRPATGGTAEVTGLEPGDEVSVWIDGAGERTSYSFVYLPPQFPRLRREAADPAAEEVAPGHVMLTLGLWTEPSPFFETAVDLEGVPVYVHETANSGDLKLQPNGHYSVARALGAGDLRGSEIVELDEQFREVGRYRTSGLFHTDGHDALLLPDGSRYLMAYEPDADSGLIDAVVQHVGADGDVLFEWSSAKHGAVADTVLTEGAAGYDDYAHINSLQVTADGDLLLSFRHLSSVWKVARTAHDGYAEGDVIWKLGGRDSTFDFPDGDDGPCAQHTATELPNGNVVVFDNGAWNVAPLCVDQADPQGPAVKRQYTRIAEWAIDEDPAGPTATLVRDERLEREPGVDRYAIFAGSAQPLPDGHTMVGWASDTTAVASELDVDGRASWELSADREPGGNVRYFSYRAFKTVVPDAIPPELSLTGLADGARLVQGRTVRPAATCTDRGGSNLATCEAPAVDTSRPGRRTYTAVSTDGAGNTTRVRRAYTVLPASRPDGLVKAAGGARFRGDDAYGARPRQQAVAPVRAGGAAVAVVRLQNDGHARDRLRLNATGGRQRFVVTTRGGVRSPSLAPGESWTTRVRVRPTARARPGDVALVRIVVASTTGGAGTDTVWFRVTRRR